MGSFPPSPAGPGWVGGQILIGCWVLLWSHPQQMFFFGRFHCPVYFKLLHHSLEVKGPRMECVVRSEGVGVELMREEQGVMYSCLFSQSYSSELKFNPSFQNLHFNPCGSQKCRHIRFMYRRWHYRSRMAICLKKVNKVQQLQLPAGLQASGYHTC